jgi:hypothetical protein
MSAFSAPTKPPENRLHRKDLPRFLGRTRSAFLQVTMRSKHRSRYQSRTKKTHCPTMFAMPGSARR